MSKDFLQEYLKLKKRADAGDPKAKAEMAKLLNNPQFVGALKQMASAKQAATSALALMTDSAAEEAAEDIIGAEEEAENLIAGDDLERADQVGRLLPPGSDSLDHKAALRSNKWKNLNDIAAFVRQNPPSILGGIPGNQATVSNGNVIAGDQGIVTPVQVAVWQGSDEEATNITVTLGLVQPPLRPFSLTPGVWRPFAVLRFGTRGFQQAVEVDIAQGTQFTVSCSYANLSISLNVRQQPRAPFAILPGGDVSTMSLSGMLSFREVTRTTNITRTHQVGNLSASALHIPIPAFAQSVSFWRAPSASVSVQLFFEDIYHNTIYDFVLGATASMFDPIPIADGVMSISVTLLAGNPTDSALIFNLNL